MTVTGGQLTDDQQLILATDTAATVTNPFADALAAGTLTLDGVDSTVAAGPGQGFVLAAGSDAGGYELYLESATPEPTSLVLLAGATASIALRRRRRAVPGATSAATRRPASG